MTLEEAMSVTERTSGEVLTIRELVESANLGLRLLAAERGADLCVEAVYIGDLEDPTPWMVPGSLLLTTGPAFESDPEASRRLVRLLKASGAVGIGVAITPHVDEVPQGMIDEAEAVGLPLLRVPPETPFRVITGYVYNALTSRDMHRLRRSLALQNQLMQVLLEEHGVEGLVRRLADFLAVDALLFDSHGVLLAQSSTEVQVRDPDLPSLVWAAYREVTMKGAPRSLLEVGDWRAHFREAVVEGAVERILVALQPLTAVVSEYDEATLTFAQRLIEVELSTTRNVSGMRRRTRASLLDMLIHCRGSATELSERLLNHGILPSHAWRILVASVGPAALGTSGSGAGGAIVDALSEGMERVLEERGTPFLSLVSSDQVVVLHPLDDEEGAAADLAEERRSLINLAERVSLHVRSTSVLVGASEPLRELRAAPVGLAHARQCLETLMSSPRPCGDVMLYEDLGLHAQLLDRMPADVLGQFRAKIVDRLQAVDRRERSDLVHTLSCYLAHDCSVAATAGTLYMLASTDVVYEELNRGRLEEEVTTAPSSRVMKSKTRRSQWPVTTWTFSAGCASSSPRPSPTSCVRW